ncbi:MAG: histidinol-phosphate transaminase [Abditibacteriota bacterium]|nr:histidinol-phosphate transaminase [Abditibacteriota bacterium]
MKTPKFRETIMQITAYVPGKPIEDVKREFGLDDVIKIASNENPLGPSPKAVEAIKAAACEINQYPDGACFELRQKLAKHLGINPENLIFGDGGDEVIFHFAEAFINPGDEIITPDTTFSEYATSALLMGGKPVTVPMKDWEIDVDALLGAVTDKTKAIYITNPNNPTGSLLPKEKIDYLLEKMPEDCLLFLDEAYYEYVDDPGYTSSLEYIKADKNVLALRTFSKVYGIAGCRIGYGIAPKRIIDLMEKTRLPFNVSRIAQKAALAALDDIDHVAKSRKVNQEGKAFLYREFDKLGLEYKPTQGNFVWVDVKTDCKALFAKLQRMGVIVRAGAPFGAPTHIRVSVGTQRELDKFIECLKKVL